MVDMNTPPPMPPPGNAPSVPMVDNSVQSTSHEELIEAIIDEKWNELVKDLNKIIDWKEQTEIKISKFEQKFSDLKESFENLHNAVIGKIGEYDKHILDVGSEIKSMENVFSKVLPVFVENVAELTRLTDDVKSVLKQQKSPSIQKLEK